MPTYQRRSTSSNTVVIVFVAGAFLLAVAGGALYFATAGSPKQKVMVAAEQRDQPQTKKPTDPKTAQPQPVPDDSRWRTEAKAEYLEALEAKQRRMSAMAVQMGRLGEGERLNAANCLRLVLAQGVEGFDNVPTEIANDAAKIAPDYIAALQRERGLRRIGGDTGYYPLAKRKELYVTFAAGVNSKTEWSVVLPFNALTQRETDSVMRAVATLRVEGLGKLTNDERRLLLKAGALEYFAAELGL